MFHSGVGDLDTIEVKVFHLLNPLKCFSPSSVIRVPSRLRPAQILHLRDRL
jgi:hypothetical protein